MNIEDQIPILVAGANGKMGREVLQTVLQQVDLRLVAALGHTRGVGEDVGVMAQGEPCGIFLSDNVEECTSKAAGGVLVDFTLGPAVKDIVLSALRHNMSCVVGTTGLPPNDMAEIDETARNHKQSVLLAPNFALGDVLMMKFAREASKYFRWAEIIELHHEKKMDAPSGTARRTAEMMRKARSDGFRAMAQEDESVKGCRGGSVGGVRIHSVRMPGLLSHQQVLFASQGETLMIQHDARTRNAYMPGVLLAIQRVRNLTGLVEGLEHVLDLP